MRTRRGAKYVYGDGSLAAAGTRPSFLKSFSPSPRSALQFLAPHTRDWTSTTGHSRTTFRSGLFVSLRVFFLSSSPLSFSIVKNYCTLLLVKPAAPDTHFTVNPLISPWPLPLLLPPLMPLMPLMPPMPTPPPSPPGFCGTLGGWGAASRAPRPCRAWPWRP